MPAPKKPSPRSVNKSAKVKAQRLDKSGFTTRVKGHVTARGKRQQASRDKR